MQKGQLLPQPAPLGVEGEARPRLADHSHQNGSEIKA